MPNCRPKGYDFSYVIDSIVFFNFVIFMNKENSAKLWKLIQETGDYLKDKLPPHPSHPKGRNPYAHVAIEIKNHFEKSYKDIPDSRYDEVVLYIQFVRESPR